MSLLDEGAKLVERQGKPLDDPAPLVHLTASQTFLDGAEIGADNLERQLTDLIELRRSRVPESPFIQAPRIYLAVDRDVPWQRIVTIAESARRAGVARVTFVFADKERTVPAPPPSPIDHELDRLRHSTFQRGQQIVAELMAYVYQDCPDALRVIASMGVHTVPEFKQAILDDLPTAVGNCNCAPDDAAVKSLHWTIFGNPSPTSGITVELAEPQSATRVETVGSALWSETHELLQAADDRVLTLAIVSEEPGEGDDDGGGAPAPKP